MHIYSNKNQLTIAMNNNYHINIINIQVFPPEFLIGCYFTQDVQMIH